MGLFIMAMGVMFFVFPLKAADFSTPNEIKEKYSYLKKEKLIPQADGSVVFHKARAWKREGINALYLHGDRYEMAYQHGMLLKDQILKGVIGPTAQLIPRVIANAFGERKALIKFAQTYIERTVVNAVLKNTNSAAGKTQMLAGYGLSDSTGISLKTILHAMVAADVLMILAARQGLDTDIPNPWAGTCTDFTVWGSLTRDGEMLIGRNLDFPLNGYFDKFPTIIYFDPTDKNTQKYVTVVSAGSHTAGLQSYNESGIFLGSHTVPTGDVSTAGAPVFVVVEGILSRAKTFDEAVALLKDNLPSTGYGYTLVSTKEKRAGTVELSSNGVSVRESVGEFHVQTNHYLTQTMKSKNLHVNNGIDTDSLARFARATQLIENKRDHICEKDAMRFLGDHIDPFSKKLRGHGNTVASSTSVSSIVLLPSENRIFVSNGMAPTAHGTFVSFPLFENFNPKTFMNQPYEKVSPSTFAVKNPKMAQALQVLIEAKKNYEYNNDSLGTLKLLRKVVKLDPSNANYHFMHGIFALKSGYFAEGKNAFTKVIDMNASPHATNLAHYYRGRVSSHYKNKGSAYRDFNAVLKSTFNDAKLKAAARTSIKKNKSWAGYKIDRNKLPIMMQQADLTAYH